MITHMGERRWKRTSKEIKETITSKQKANVNSMGSLVFCIQHKGICCCSNMKDNFKTTLGYVETHLSLIFSLSIPHPIK
jgi:transcriptional/translational regulatory protein YebC/TACO1